MDNVKTVYPPQKKFAGGINKIAFLYLKIIFVLVNSVDYDEMPPHASSLFAKVRI